MGALLLLFFSNNIIIPCVFTSDTKRAQYALQAMTMYFNQDYLNPLIAMQRSFCSNHHRSQLTYYVETVAGSEGNAKKNTTSTQDCQWHFEVDFYLRDGRISDYVCIFLE